MLFLELELLEGHGLRLSRLLERERRLEGLEAFLEPSQLKRPFSF
jgi:hypothetical protein